MPWVLYLRLKMIFSSELNFSCLCAQSYPTLHNSLDCSLPGSSVYGTFQARILEWVAISSRKSSWSVHQTCVSSISCIGRHILYHWVTWEAHKYVVVVVVQPLSMSNSLWPHGLQCATLLSPSLSAAVCSNPCPLSLWCCLIISSS